MQTISTTKLSQKMEMSAQELFAKLAELGLIIKKDKKWELTEQGKGKGGCYKESKTYGQYIVWPEDLSIQPENQTVTNKTTSTLITATAIGGHYELSARKINHILSELGWVKKHLKGWLLTKQGEKQKGLQCEDKRTGIPYVRWTESIIDAEPLKNTINETKGTYISAKTNADKPDATIGFREKFKAEYRSTDGHFVRSKAEMLIDNWLYMAEIVHAYERKLPITEDVYSDFYIPTGKVYIEYWGYENEEKYQRRKQEKITIYKKYSFNLIELYDNDVQNIDDILPRLLLKHNVQAY